METATCIHGLPTNGVCCVECEVSVKTLEDLWGFYILTSDNISITGPLDGPVVMEDFTGRWEFTLP